MKLSLEELAFILQSDLDIGAIVFLYNREVLKESVHPKVKVWIQSLVRKQFMTEDFDLTSKGQELIEKLNSLEKNEQVVTPIETVSIKSTKEKFKEWWKVYPSTNNFEYKGKKFMGTQKKNLKKEACEQLFSKYIVNREFTAEEIIEATRYHINLAMEESFKTGINKLDFVPNSERYLRERYFEPYIKIYKKVTIPEVSAPKELDI